jgi:Zn-dependent protease with chaperone function
MNVIDAARTILPWWVGWLGVIVYLPFGFLFSLASSCLLCWWALRPFSRQQPELWVERARLVYPGTLVSQHCLVLFPAMFGAMAVAVHGPFTKIPLSILVLLSAAAAFAGAALVAWQVQRRVRLPGLSFGQWLRGYVAYCLIFLPHLLVVILCAVLFPLNVTPEVIWILIGITGLFAFLAWGGGLDVARLFELARPASDRLRAIVASASKRAGIEPPPTYELTMNHANVLAFVVCRRLAFTSPAMELLSDGHLEAVCSHELGHLREPPIVKTTRFLAVFLYLPIAAAKPLIGLGDAGLAAALACAVIGLGGTLAMRVLSRRMEFRADRMAKTEETGAGMYAAALERIYAYNLVPAVLRSWGETHPSLYDRLMSLGYTPNYPRPAPPPRLLIPRFLTPAVVVVSVLLIVAFLYGKFYVHLAHRDDENTLLVLMALGGGTASELRDVAYCRSRDGKIDDAIAFYRASGAIDETAPYDPASAAMLLVDEKRCDEAEECLQEAQRRLRANPAAQSEDYKIVRDAELAVRYCRILDKHPRTEESEN